MAAFLSRDFLLENKIARTLYFEYAADLPIIDYHSHLSPADIAADRSFGSISELWLEGDHYKWRAMRANGVDELYCTGMSDDREKFKKWAATVPFTLRNPLYHWTHMELKNPFGIARLLGPESADGIYDAVNRQLKERFTTRRLLTHFHVEALCTSDEPLDGLEHHAALAREGFKVKVRPSFRPDAALLAERTDLLLSFIHDLAAATGAPIDDFRSFTAALKSRHDYFAAHGCTLSDHGFERVFSRDYTAAEVELIFAKILRGENPAPEEIGKYRSALQYELSVMNHEKGWTQQFHIGALRNTNTKMLKKLGRNSGHDSIGDANLAADLARFLDRLEAEDRLTKTIIYNLNPKDNAVFAAMIGNFQDGRTPGKIQWGPAWWFLDNQAGIEEQLNVLSTQGLLSRFIGMTTDSRSFLSFSRHEYFRRILCNLLGKDAARGLLPGRLDLLGPLVKNVCYLNAKNYFQF